MLFLGIPGFSLNWLFIFLGINFDPESSIISKLIPNMLVKGRKALTLGQRKGKIQALLLVQGIGWFK